MMAKLTLGCVDDNDIAQNAASYSLQVSKLLEICSGKITLNVSRSARLVFGRVTRST